MDYFGADEKITCHIITMVSPLKAINDILFKRRGIPITIFSKIEPTRAYQVVINQLEDAILAGKLASGDKLPAERELINAFGTSRRTLREAFRVLEQKGLIDIKIGSKGGTFVADRVGEKLSETLSLFIRKEGISNEEVAEFRAATEGTVAALAAKRADKKDFNRIGKYISEIERLLEKKALDKHKFVEKEMGLHQELARICGNTMYALIVKTVHDILLRPAFLQDRIDSVYARRMVSHWKDLLQALKKRDSSRARDVIEQHILAFVDTEPR